VCVCVCVCMYAQYMHLRISSSSSNINTSSSSCRTLPAFLGLLGVTTLYYTVCKGDENDWWWHVRMDPVTGKKVSHNFNTQVCARVYRFHM